MEGKSDAENPQAHSLVHLRDAKMDYQLQKRAEILTLAFSDLV